MFGCELADSDPHFQVTTLHPEEIDIITLPNGSPRMELELTGSVFGFDTIFVDSALFVITNLTDSSTLNDGTTIATESIVIADTARTFPGNFIGNFAARPNTDYEIQAFIFAEKENIAGNVIEYRWE